MQLTGGVAVVGSLECLDALFKSSVAFYDEGVQQSVARVRTDVIAISSRAHRVLSNFMPEVSEES